MDKQNTKNKSGCLTFILTAFIVCSAFILLAGIIMLCASSKERLGSVICIVIGAVTLIFFGALAYLASHPGNKFSTFLLAGLGITICGSLTVGVLGIAAYSIAYKPFADMEHYRKVWKNPVSVVAVVTDHSSYSDDGDTDYRSHVTYDYNGTRYEDFVYEDMDNKNKLTPIGQEVTLQISPKDPTKQISKLRRQGLLIPMTLLLMLLGIAALYKYIQLWIYGKKPKDAINPERIRKDIIINARCRLTRPFYMLGWMGCGFLYLRYYMVFGIYPLIVAIGFAAAWLYCMHTTVRDCRYAENHEYDIRTDVLIDKSEVTDSESNSTTYYLHYKGVDDVWKTGVSYNVYSKAKNGDTVTSVYLPNKAKPIVHYNHNIPENE